MQTILKVEYIFLGCTYNSEFILFEGDTLKNLLPIDSQVISIKVLKTV